MEQGSSPGLAAVNRSAAVPMDNVDMQRAAGPILSQDELAEMLVEAADLGDLGCRPLPAVLDIDFIRTGSHDRLKMGMPPATAESASRTISAIAAGTRPPGICPS